MAKWWMGVALAAVVAGQPNAALAQYPDPVPCAPSSLGGGAASGLLPPGVAPPGPGSDLSISANAPGAFSPDDYHHEFGCYFFAGGLGLQAGRPRGHTQIAFMDPGGGLKTGVRPTDPAVLSDTIFSFSSFVPDLEWGVSGTLGITMDEWAIEASGFYIPLQGRSKTTDAPGLLDLNFFNAPLGFEGTHGLWLQADRVKLSQSYALVDGELNIRYDGCGLIPLIGFRYLEVQERMSILTDENGLTFPMSNGLPDPTTVATYRINQRSRIVAGQAGLEAQLPLGGCFVLVGSAKGAWGQNFYEKTTSLFRGDGLLGFNSQTSHNQFSQIYEAGVFLDYYCKEHCRVRAGYNFLWLVDVPVAKDQIDFNLQNVNGARNDHGVLFFYGPQVEIQFMF